MWAAQTITLNKKHALQLASSAQALGAATPKKTEILVLLHFTAQRSAVHCSEELGVRSALIFTRLFLRQ